MKNKKMKRLLVFVSAILIGLFLLNSFALGGFEAKKDSRLNTGSKAMLLKAKFKSNDGGQTWLVISETQAKVEFPSSQINIVEIGGVLIGTDQRGIKRSADNGKHWEWVIAEGGVGIAVERINGGIAAISYNTATKTRRMRISMDKGENWQIIDEGMPPSPLISSIKQVGQYLICGHPDGIYRSADMGKTWKKVLRGVNDKESLFFEPWKNTSSKDKKVFKLHVSGDVLYAAVVPAGC